MSVIVKPNGTRGTRRPPMPRLLIAGMARLFAAWFKRSGAKMRVAGQPLLLLTTIGAKSGKERAAMLGYWADPTTTDGSVLVVGSNQGSAQQSAWLVNMAAHPDRVWIERESGKTLVRPETLEGEERAITWAMLVKPGSPYAKYKDQTDREIPIVRLRPITPAS
jgi:deazaflavin-dependent oxidoreductase (nitroreductase family)